MPFSYGQQPNPPASGKTSASNDLDTPYSKYFELLKRKRLETLACITAAIPNAVTRLSPYYDEEAVQLNWRAVVKEEWTDDEIQALQWLRSFWEQKMFVKPRPLRSGLFPEDAAMRQAILLALSLESYTAHLIDDYYRPKREYSVSTPERTIFAKEGACPAS